MNADEALIRAFDLGMGDAGWTEEVMDEAELLLPTLVEAGYAAREANTWWFTKEGVTRHEKIVIEGPALAVCREDRRLGQCSGMTAERC